MIRLLAFPQYERLAPLCQDSALGARILSGVRMYGKYPFADAWVQEQDGVTTAAIFRLDAALTVLANGSPDWAELQGFVRMGLGQTLLSEPHILGQLGLSGPCGNILTLTRTPVPIEPSGPPPRFQDVHQLLEQCRDETFAVPEWEPFYLDLSHRFRHGGAHLAALSDHGQVTACAMTVAETPDFAVLGAVAVHPQKRRQGLGQQVVRRLLRHLPQPHIAVLCTPSNGGFYENLGFRQHSHWMEGCLEP